MAWGKWFGKAIKKIQDNTYGYCEETGEPIYELSSNHTILNPDLPEGDYEVYFYVTMRRNRNQFGIKDARFGIYTEAFKRNSLEI